jgi:TRAP-type C4-dicarboxylate transport system substrate-binding protein
MTRLRSLICTGALSLMLLAASSSAAHAAPRKFRNCDTLNNVYPHGVGLPSAKDDVGSRKDGPVTDFKKDAALYRAQSKTLDRDNDGIACEKH